LSDVVVSVVESKTTVAVTQTSVDVNVTETPVTITTATAGPQGAVGQGFPTGGSLGQLLVKQSATNYDAVWQTLGTVGYSTTSGTAVYASTAGSATSAGSALTAGTASYGTLAGTSVYATNAGTAVYGSTAGTASYSTTSGTASYATTAGSVGTATYATTSGTAVYATSAGSASNAGAATTAGTATYATTSGTASYGTLAGTAVYATTSGTAVYSTTSGTAVGLSGSITKSQVSDFTAGTVAYATSAGSASTAGAASTAGTATYATTAGTSSYATTSGTSVYATTSGTATYGTTSGTAVYATNAGTAVSISGSITESQVTNLTTDLASKVSSVTAADSTITIAGTSAAPTVAVGSIAQSQVTGLSTALTAKAPTASPTFTGTVTTPLTTAGYVTTTSGGVIGSVSAIPQSDVTSLVSDLAGKASTSSVTSGLALKANLAGGNALTGAQTISTSATTDKPLILNAVTGQTANLQEWQVNGSVLASISSAGIINNSTAGIITKYARLNASYLGTLSLQAESASTIGAVIRGAASQSANLQEWQNSAGTTILSISSNGSIIQGTSTNRFQVDATFGQVSIRNGGTNSGSLVVGTGAAGTQGIVVKGVASQTANLTEWQTSAGGIAMAVTKDSWLAIYNSTAPAANATSGGYLYVEAGALKYRGSSGTITTIAAA
jgi:hypothetical protein